MLLVEEELSGIRSLVKDGYAPKVQQIGLEKELNDLASKEMNWLQVGEKAVQATEELKFKLDSAKERLTIAQRSLKQKKKLRQLCRGRLLICKNKLGVVVRPTGENHGYCSER